MKSPEFLFLLSTQVYAKNFLIPKIQTSLKVESMATTTLIQPNSFVLTTLWRSWKDFSLYFLFCLYSKILGKKISDQLELLDDRKNMHFLHTVTFPPVLLSKPINQKVFYAKLDQGTFVFNSTFISVSLPKVSIYNMNQSYMQTDLA